MQSCVADRGAANHASPFRHFHASPETIHLVVMKYVRFPLSLRNVEDLLFEHEIDIIHATVRLGSRHAPGKAALLRW